MADRQVVSSDGTVIAFGESGSGPPLVLVHGTTNDRTSFRFVEPILADHFTVHSIDRRGRGASGDSRGEYRIEQEFDDIAAVVDSLDQPADLLGHSYGATITLGAALQCDNLRRLVLYEPTPGVPNVDDPAELDRLDHLLAAGNSEELLRTVMVDLAGMEPPVFEELRASPVWPNRLAATPTVPREFRAEEACHLEPDALAGLTVPTMFLVGTESPAFAREATDQVASMVANARVVELAGQGHVATLTAPELVAAEVVAFLTET
jgi:pimeloyl-ACP methyl ester carboxylesterase